MAEKTKIPYCDHTANAWRGCQRVHVGCDHCFAAAIAKRNPAMFGIWGSEGEYGTRVYGGDKVFRDVVRWDRRANKTGVTERVFWNDMSDTFEVWIGLMRDSAGRWLGNPHGIEHNWLTMSDIRLRIFETIDATPNLTHILLTKRPENIWRMFPEDQNPGMEGIPAYLTNVWLLFSASDQATLDAGLPYLLECCNVCPVIGLSLEPLIGRVVIPEEALQHLRFVVAGGESGAHYRPCEVSWIADIVEQCRAAGIPVWVKQDSNRYPGRQGRIPDELWNVKELPTWSKRAG